MAYPKKEFPHYVIGIIRSEEGYSVCEFLVNEERRIKFIDKLPSDILSIALGRARKKLIKHSRGEPDASLDEVRKDINSLKEKIEEKHERDEPDASEKLL